MGQGKVAVELRPLQRVQEARRRKIQELDKESGDDQGLKEATKGKGQGPREDADDTEQKRLRKGEATPIAAVSPQPRCH